MSKYNAKRTVVDGIKFDSKGEALRYQDLKILERTGDISGLSLQPQFSIDINGIHVCKVLLDFSYLENGNVVYEDFKGFDNSVSKLKRKLLKAQHGIDVLITGGASK